MAKSKRYPAVSTLDKLLKLLCKEAGESDFGPVAERAARLGKAFTSKQEIYKWLDGVYLHRKTAGEIVAPKKAKKTRKPKKTPSMAERMWGEKYPSIAKMNAKTPMSSELILGETFSAPVREEKPAKTWRQLAQEFYASDAWRVARFQTLKDSDGCCCLCGRSKREHGVVLHVDHIKPRSKFPHLALTLSNLQILCEDCNLGKGNRDDTDWRPTIIEGGKS